MMISAKIEMEEIRTLHPANKLLAGIQFTRRLDQQQVHLNSTDPEVKTCIVMQFPSFSGEFHVYSIANCLLTATAFHF